MFKSSLIWLLGAAAALSLPAVRADEAAPYHVTAKYAIGGAGSYDYVRLDPQERRLYVSHQTVVEVVDADTGKKMGAITGLHGVHGIALAKDLGRGFITNGLDGVVTVFDTGTLKVLQTIRTRGEKPDAVEYDADSGKVFVSNGHSNDATVIDAKSGAIERIIPLKGNPESIVFDGRGRVLVNLESHNSVAQIDLKTAAVLADWPLGSGEGPTGLAIDLKTRRLFASCGGNQKLVVLDADNGHPVAVLPIGDDSDGAAFDPATRQVFSSNRDGTLTVIQEDDADHFRVLAGVPTQFGAKTLAVDSDKNRIYLPVAKFAPGPDEDHPGPTVPGSFTVLVVGR